MIRREKVRAIVLSRRELGEADQLLTLFTRTHGVITAVAKGARKIPSRRGGHLEPLTQVLALISGSAGRYYIGAVEPIETYSALHKKESALQHAMQLAHIIRSGVSEADIDASLFDAVHDGLLQLPSVTVGKQQQIEVALSLKILQATGISPDLTICQACQETQPKDVVVIDGTIGGWRCLSCHGSFAGAETSLTPRGFKALKWLTAYPSRAANLKLTAEESGQILAAMRAYLHTAMQMMPPEHKQSTVLAT